MDEDRRIEATRSRSPAGTSEGKAPATSAKSAISAFLGAAQATRNVATAGRLVIALDATMSRQPTWDRACAIQAEMFTAAGKVGRLAMQLVYFRGFGECAASRWVDDGETLAGLMTRIDCRGGQTQIRKVLRHAIDETRRRKVQALVYIGDCVEEDVDALCARAGELGLLGVPAFIFQDGADAHAQTAFREIARLTRGAHFRLDGSSARELAELLKAAAVYAAAGREGLERLTRGGDGGAKRLLRHMG
ncbi:VWA domain-containing protein [Stappia sp. TSB10GB4]|uniref:VWA domain-containing protein n=1 Tax=Stappia sp. TSB10GB4 TaxID=2003584 RepID=UPI00352A5744